MALVVLCLPAWLAACGSCHDNELFGLTVQEDAGPVAPEDGGVPPDGGVPRDGGQPTIDASVVLTPPPPEPLPTPPLELACPRGEMLCGDACVDVSANLQHCGGCNQPCGDTNACNGVELCIDGTCQAGTPPRCDDGNPCTADSCAADGSCQHTVVEDGTSCLLASACSTSSVCQAGACVGQDTVDCDDGNPCTVDGCDPSGGCTNEPAVDGTSCADDNLCNGAEQCLAGSCQPADPLRCNDGNACTADACDPVLGCMFTASANGTTCDDGNACNGVAACTDGACRPGGSPDCDDGNPCTADSCDPVAGCVHTPVADGTGCDDGDVCNGVAACSAGACVQASAPSCDDGNVCTDDTCDPQRGCMNTAVAESVSCDDGDVCNGVSMCVAGACKEGSVPLCDDGNPCTADSCDPVLGCVNVPVADGTSCDDGDACNGISTCMAGSCAPGIVPICDDGNVCTADACDPATGCTHSPVADGTTCDDGDACNGVAACSAGSCVNATPPNCDDNNLCTADSCNPAVGCLHAPAADGTSCDDGDACNGLAACSAGRCVNGAAPQCDDGNPCTADGCDPAGGCFNTPLANGTSCADANLCDGEELCQAGVCTESTPMACNDGNPCTVDGCEPDVGCTTTAAEDGTSCSDGIACNGEEQCHQGACLDGIPLTCDDDGNPCTLDVCGANGCEHRPFHDEFPCSDDVVCNGQELCYSGECVLGSDPVCDDNNPCTAESCNGALNRCLYTPVPDGTPCDDRNPATTDDMCTAGVCGEGRATERVSEPPTGVEGNDHSEKPFLSDDGNFIAFQSQATNLIGGDTNTVTDVFVVDVRGGSPERVSTTAAGGQGNNISRLATPNRGLPGNAISGNGQRVAFISLANNLVPGDSNDDWDVFVKDRGTGEVRRVSVSSAGSQAMPPSNPERWNRAFTLSGEPAISQDGRYVAFSSYAPNLVGDDRNGSVDVFRHDLVTGETVLVSRSSSGAQGNGDSDMPSISGDGRCVAFRSLAGNINHDPMKPDTNFQYDIYVRDLAAGYTVRVSESFDGGETNHVSYYPRISADCSRVTWVSWADNLVPNDTNRTLDVFVRDVAGGPTTRVNTSATGVQANLRTGGPPTINRNGRYIAFYSWATNLVPEDHNLFCRYRAIVNSLNCIDIFIKDLWTGALTRVSLTEGGQEAWQNSQDPSISGDGTGLAFGSYANNLDADKGNGLQDVFYTRTWLDPSP